MIRAYGLLAGVTKFFALIMWDEADQTSGEI